MRGSFEGRQGNLQSAQAGRVGDDVDFRDFAVEKREAQGAEETSARRNDDAGRTVDESRASEDRVAGEGDGLPGPVFGSAKFGCRRGKAGCEIGVSDDVWDEAARHYDEQALAILVFSIAMINFFNRVNIATRQVAGEWVNSAEAKAWRKQQEAVAS